MQPNPTDISSRPQSPDGFWSWDGAQWVTNGVGPWPTRFAPPRLRSDLAVAFLLILVTLNVFDVINSSLDLALYRGLTGSHLGGSDALGSQWRNALVGLSWLLVAFPGCVVFGCIAPTETSNRLVTSPGCRPQRRSDGSILRSRTSGNLWESCARYGTRQSRDRPPVSWACGGRAGWPAASQAPSSSG